MFILHELVGTKYVTKQSESLFRDALTKIIAENKTEEKPVVDVCFCKFQTDTEKLLDNYYKYIKFVDSHDDAVNELLSQNDIRLNSKDKNSNIVNIPYHMTIEQVHNFLSSLKEDSTYSLLSPVDKTDNNTVGLDTYLAFIIGFEHPNISLRIDKSANAFFNEFNKFWSFNKKYSKDAYYVWYNSSIQVVKTCGVNRLSKTNMFRVAGCAKMSESQFCSGVQQWKLIPYVFGREVIDENTKHKDLLEAKNDVWVSLIDYVDKNSDNIVVKKPSLLDIIPTIGDNYE